ncbi:MAG: 4Fe-4S dicluster domain-containing protein [Firmicutes bacterium]|nr:4Fe-4S dicluster domain-containing protein [Bacillota bacterium]
MGRAATWETWKPDPGNPNQHVAMLVDTSECIGCKACEVACKQWNLNEARINQEPGTYQSHPHLDAQTWTLIRFVERTNDQGEVEWLFQKHNCMHCTEAGCVTACPTDALQYGNYGVVTLDQEKCIGCAYCEQACPFDAIHVDRNPFNPRAQKAGKCTLCYDRITAGMQPACVKTCPTDCIKFGDRDALIEWGRQRVEELKARGFKNANLYGVDQLGGLHELYVLLEPPEVYGLPANPKISTWTKLWKYAVQPLGKLAVGAGLFGLAVNWVAARRAFLQGQAAGHGESDHAAGQS